MVIREQIVLQLSPQQCSGFTAQTLDHMAKIDAPQRLLALAGMQARQGFDELAAQEQIQPVVMQVHRQLLSDQP